MYLSYTIGHKKCSHSVTMSSICLSGCQITLFYDLALTWIHQMNFDRIKDGHCFHLGYQAPPRKNDSKRKKSSLPGKMVQTINKNIKLLQSGKPLTLFFLHNKSPAPQSTQTKTITTAVILCLDAWFFWRFGLLFWLIQLSNYLICWGKVTWVFCWASKNLFSKFVISHIHFQHSLCACFLTELKIATSTACIPFFMYILQFYEHLGVFYFLF